MKHSILRRCAIGAAALVAAAGMVGLSAVNAGATDPDETFPGGQLFSGARYDNVTGGAHITKGNFDVPIGPTSLTANVGFADDTVGVLKYYAALPLPPKTVSFKAFGYLPVRAKVSFAQVGPATGTIVFAEGGVTPLNGEAHYVVSLSDVYVGYTAANVGPNCQTRYPIDVTYSGSSFNVFDGGDLTGSFDLGKLNNCRTSTDLANLIVPGNGNTLKLHVPPLNLDSLNGDQARKVARLKTTVAAKK